MSSPELQAPTCAVCGGTVNHHKHDGSVAASVEGWEVLRAEGGANQITHRQRTGQWAHKSCLEPLHIALPLLRGAKRHSATPLLPAEEGPLKPGTRQGDAWRRIGIVSHSEARQGHCDVKHGK